MSSAQVAPSHRPPAEFAPWFTCTAHRDDGVTCVVLGGELDLATAPSLRRALRQVELSGATVVVDLRALGFMDCAGAYELLRSHRRLRRLGGRLVVLRESGAFDLVFRFAGLERLSSVVCEPPSAKRL